MAAFASPYIPTVGSTVTRSADAAVMTGANFSRWFRADEGSFVVEASYIGTGQQSSVYVGDGTTSNGTWLGNNSSGTSALVDLFSRAGGTNQAVISSGVTAASGVGVKIAGSYKVDDFRISANGSGVVADTSAVVPAADRMLIGQYIYTAARSQYIKSIQYYPARLTNAQLQAVTA